MDCCKESHLDHVEYLMFLIQIPDAHVIFSVTSLMDYLEVSHLDPVEYLMFSKSLTSMISDVHLKQEQFSPE